MVSSLLSGVLEGAHKVGDIIVVVIGSGLAVEVGQGALEELVLLGTELLQDIWHQFLEVLGLSKSSNHQQVLFDGELG